MRSHTSRLVIGLGGVGEWIRLLRALNWNIGPRRTIRRHAPSPQNAFALGECGLSSNTWFLGRHEWSLNGISIA